MKTFLRWVGIVLLVFVVLTAVAGTLMVRWARVHMPQWPERLEGVRLQPALPVLRADGVTSNNAYFYLRQLDFKITEFKLDDAAKTELSSFLNCGLQGTNYPAIDAFLAKPQPAIELVERAAAMAQCQVETDDNPGMIIPVGPVVGVCKLLVYRAERAANAGDWTGAARDYRCMVKSSQQVTRGGSLIHHLIGLAGEGLACRGMRRVALEGKPPADWTREMIALLGEAEASAEPFAEAMRYERLMSRWCVDQVFTNPGALMAATSLSGEPQQRPGLELVMRSPLLRWLGSGAKQTGAHFDALYSHIVDIAEKPYVKGRFDHEVESLFNQERRGANLLADDPIGRVLAQLLVPALNAAQSKANYLKADRKGTALFLAVCQYRREHGGKPPAALGELVPEYIAAVPVDPFSPTGEPLRWTQNDGRWCLYSLGSDQDDDGGLFDEADQRFRREQKDRLDVCLASDEFDVKRRERDERAKKER